MKIVNKHLLRLTTLTMGIVGATRLVVPKKAHAQSWMPPIGPDVDSLAELIQIGLNTAIVFAAIVAVAFLIFNGFKYISSAGDTAKTEEAQKGIANALIGLVVALCAAIVVNFVLNLLRVETPDLPS